MRRMVSRTLALYETSADDANVEPALPQWLLVAPQLEWHRTEEASRGASVGATVLRARWRVGVPSGNRNWLPPNE
jgi:hypothetical protein